MDGVWIFSGLFLCVWFFINLIAIRIGIIAADLCSLNPALIYFGVIAGHHWPSIGSKKKDHLQFPNVFVILGCYNSLTQTVT